MKIIGLTGGIAMGKSTLGGRLAPMGRQTGLGLWLFDADRAVHHAMLPGRVGYRAIVAALQAPLAARGQRLLVGGAGSAIDRQALGAAVFAVPALRAQLEGILHPLVYRQTRQRLAAARRLGVRAVVLDIPLLFEIGAERRCDRIASLWVTPRLQARRALARPGMSAGKLARIRRAQLAPALRAKHSDLVINSGGGVALAYRQFRRALARWADDKRGAKRYRPRRRHYGGLRGGAWPPLTPRHGFFRR